jgi:hypothetical protein
MAMEAGNVKVVRGWRMRGVGVVGGGKIEVEDGRRRGKVGGNMPFSIRGERVFWQGVRSEERMKKGHSPSPLPLSLKGRGEYRPKGRHPLP